MLKTLITRNRLTAVIALLCCLCMLVGVFAFFTDRISKSATATAGNMDLVFTDISSSKTGANGITSNNEFAIDQSWEYASLVADGGILNPGDYFDLSYNLSNTGSKSMDVRQQLTLTSNVPLTGGAEEYKLTITGEDYNTTAVTGVLSADGYTITYDLSDITLNGSVEKESGVTWTEQTYTVRLDFDIDAKNTFMDSVVVVNLKAQAKQSRNTTDADWATWAEYTTKFEEVGSEVEAVPFTLIEGKSLSGTGSVNTSANYMITDYIPCETGYKYTITENQTYTIPEGSNSMVRTELYDENKNFIGEISSNARTETTVYTRTFVPTSDAKYFRSSFRITDEDISITRTKTDISINYLDCSSIGQGLAVSEDYIFIGSGKSGAPTSYKIRKIDRATGEVIVTSTETFNHTNDIAYNSNTNELIVTGLNGATVDDDYSLLVVDADTLTLKEKINLRNEVTSVCPESIGISAVTYNANLDEYYVLTRSPERHIITLNSDFEMKSSIFLGIADDIPGQMGGMFADNNYFYIANTLSSDVPYTNEIRIYDRTGDLVSTKSIDGLYHIEGVDYIDGRYYVVFIPGDMNTHIYSMKEIQDIK